LGVGFSFGDNENDLELGGVLSVHFKMVKNVNFACILLQLKSVLCNKGHSKVTTFKKS
jgi:hypothetical protein